MYRPAIQIGVIVEVYLLHTSGSVCNLYLKHGPKFSLIHTTIDAKTKLLQ